MQIEREKKRMDDYVKRPEFDSLKSQVERLEGEMAESNKLLTAIDKKIDVISEKIINADKIDSLKLAPIEKRVDTLEDGQKWVRRTIIGEIIAIVIGAIVYVIQTK